MVGCLGIAFDCSCLLIVLIFSFLFSFVCVVGLYDRLVGLGCCFDLFTVGCLLVCVFCLGCCFARWLRFWYGG